MIWTDINTVYESTIINHYSPFYFKDGILYVITSWSIGTVMKGAGIEDGIINKAEGKEIVIYGN